MENLAAIHAAVFSLSAKNLRGGGDIRPPSRARVNVPGRLDSGHGPLRAPSDTVPSRHAQSRSLASVRFLPQTARHYA